MIKIPQDVIDLIMLHGKEQSPIEACGYLAGRDKQVQVIIPMTNADNSPEHFSFDPEEQFAALDKARTEDLELIAVYHTHQATPARMSAEDISLAYDTDIVYLIYSLKYNDIRAFRINGEKQVREVSIEVV